VGERLGYAPGDDGARDVEEGGGDPLQVADGEVLHTLVARNSAHRVAGGPTEVQFPFRADEREACDLDQGDVDSELIVGRLFAASGAQWTDRLRSRVERASSVA
jgi:hypothetical protein